VEKFAGRDTTLTWMLPPQLLKLNPLVVFRRLCLGHALQFSTVRCCCRDLGAIKGAIYDKPVGDLGYANEGKQQIVMVSLTQSRQ
jgi:hypothetical protein